MLWDVGIQLNGFEEKLRSFPAFEFILEDNMGRYPTVLDPADIHYGKGLEKLPAFGKTFLFQGNKESFWHKGDEGSYRVGFT